jgi:hypothetical protein
MGMASLLANTHNPKKNLLEADLSKKNLTVP